MFHHLPTLQWAEDQFLSTWAGGDIQLFGLICKWTGDQEIEERQDDTIRIKMFMCMYQLPMKNVFIGQILLAGLTGR